MFLLRSCCLHSFLCLCFPAVLLQFLQVRALLAEIKAENACLQLKDLAVNGNDLLALGLTGKQIGETLNSLLEQVMDDVLPNDRSVLLEAAKNRN